MQEVIELRRLPRWFSGAAGTQPAAQVRRDAVCEDARCR